MYFKVNLMLVLLQVQKLRRRRQRTLLRTADEPQVTGHMQRQEGSNSYLMYGNSQSKCWGKALRVHKRKKMRRGQRDAAWDRGDGGSGG